MDPSRNAPRAILRALVASFLIGGLILLLRADGRAQTCSAKQLSTDGLQYVVLATLGPTVGEVDAVVRASSRSPSARWPCTPPAIRLAFAMARDNNLPAASLLARVSPRFQTPVLPTVSSAWSALVILVVNINQPQIFSVVTSIAIIMIYLAYLLVTVPMLVRGCAASGSPPRAGSRWAASGCRSTSSPCCGARRMSLNLAWPRAEVYNATGPHHWYLRWGAFLFVGVVARRRLRLLLVRPAAHDRRARRAPRRAPRTEPPSAAS